MYHTALFDPQVEPAPREYWAAGRNYAFVHDLSDGIPPEFGEADLIYAEVPWKDGFHTFGERAGVRQKVSYAEWAFRLSAGLIRLGKPFVLVGGAAMSRHMAWEWFRRVDLNGSVSAAIGAGLPPPPDEIRDAETLILHLAGNPLFLTVGDPCCGFGRTLRIFMQAGKFAIGSDLNPRCIGYIADNASKWMAECR